MALAKSGGFMARQRIRSFDDYNLVHQIGSLYVRVVGAVQLLWSVEVSSGSSMDLIALSFVVRR